MTARDRLAIWFAVGNVRVSLAWVAGAVPDLGAMNPDPWAKKVAHLRNHLGWVRNCLADFLYEGKL